MTKANILKFVITNLYNLNDNRPEVIALCELELVHATPKEELIPHLWAPCDRNNPYSGEIAQEAIIKKLKVNYGK